MNGFIDYTANLIRYLDNHPDGISPESSDSEDDPYSDLMDLFMNDSSQITHSMLIEAVQQYGPYMPIPDGSYRGDSLESAAKLSRFMQLMILYTNMPMTKQVLQKVNKMYDNADMMDLTPLLQAWSRRYPRTYRIHCDSPSIQVQLNHWFNKGDVFDTLAVPAELKRWLRSLREGMPGMLYWR